MLRQTPVAVHGTYMANIYDFYKPKVSITAMIFDVGRLMISQLA